MLGLLQGAAGAALTRLSQDGLAWVPTCCNLAALLCFGLCLTLNSAVTGGQPAAILLLAPLLLLLAQDPLLLRWLEERRRYLPSVAAVSAYLAATAIWQLVGEVADDLPLSSEMWWYAAKHLGCLAAVLPCQLYLLAWLWNKRQVGEGRFPAAAVLLLPCFTASWLQSQHLGARHAIHRPPTRTRGDPPPLPPVPAAAGGAAAGAGAAQPRGPLVLRPR